MPFPKTVPEEFRPTKFFFDQAWKYITLPDGNPEKVLMKEEPYRFFFYKFLESDTVPQCRTLPFVCATWCSMIDFVNKLTDKNKFQIVHSIELAFIEQFGRRSDVVRKIESELSLALK